MKNQLDRFRKVYLVDTEFVPRPGERPIPVCIVARDYKTKHTIRKWRDELSALPPFPHGPDILFVCYFAPAELGFYRVMNWEPPPRILDLYVEYRNCYNCLPTVVEQKLYEKGEKKPGRNSLVGALMQFGLPTIGASEKKKMTDRISRGGPWTPDEKLAIVNYCEDDVIALDRLLTAMLPRLDLPRALYRGRYMPGVAAMEYAGVPIDVELLKRLRARWKHIRQELVTRVDAQFGVYEGTSFRSDKFAHWLDEHGILWPRYPSGALILTDETFREMAKIHSELNALRELRHALSQTRLNDLTVGADGRNRVMISPFGARTSRNTPSNSKFILGPSVWLRGLIKPPPGSAVGYIDWVAQEIGIAAARSNDSAMKSAYESGDPYLWFAKAAKAVPEDATPQTHKLERALHKQCMLGVNYGMEERSLSLRINQHVLVARSMLLRHREIFWRFWEWSDNQVRRAMLTGITSTIFGWRYHVTTDHNVRSIRNFSMQATGAEILRLAICLGVENGIEICGPAHDAVFILAPLEQLGKDIARMRDFMEEASRIVLGGFKLRTEFTAVRYPKRHMDPRGREFWDIVMSLL